METSGSLSNTPSFPFLFQQRRLSCEISQLLNSNVSVGDRALKRWEPPHMTRDSGNQQALPKRRRNRQAKGEWITLTKTSQFHLWNQAVQEADGDQSIFLQVLVASKAKRVKPLSVCACERFHSWKITAATLFTRQGLFHPGGQVLGRGKMQPNTVLATAADAWTL